MNTVKGYLFAMATPQQQQKSSLDVYNISILSRLNPPVSLSRHTRVTTPHAWMEERACVSMGGGARNT